MAIVVAVASDGSITWEEALPPLIPQGPAEVDMDAAVPIYVNHKHFDTAPVTIAQRKRAA